mmetsp:Transcript_12778/g.33476  ORF Transcript_12778/g.33476 Transcript_12778/m.33476 type:complete len:417 (-) Transcript_12778:981-2231(-)
MELLVHLHRLLHQALLQQQLLGARQLAHQHRELRLHREVLDARASDPRLRLHVAHHVVHLVQVAALGDIADGAEASLRREQVLALEGELRELLPHALRLRRELESLEHRARAVQIALLHCGAKRDERLVELVRDGVHALVHNDLRAAGGALDVLDLALDGHDGDALGRVDVVPDAQVGAVLRDDDVRVGHPLHVAREREQRRARRRGDVVQMERPAFVTEDELGRAAVHLHPVDLGLVRDRRLGDRRRQVHDAYRLQVEQVGDLLHLRLGPLGVTRLVEPDGDEVGRHVLGAARAEDLVAAVLDQGELARVEDHGDLVVVEEELLVARAGPRHLREAARLQVAREQGLDRVRDQEAILVDVDLGHLVAKVGLEHDARARREALDDHRRRRDVRELELGLVPHAPDARVVHVHRAAQ